MLRKGSKHTSEARAKMCRRQWSAETRAKLEGYQHTAETRAKMSKSHSGKTLTPEHCESIRKARLGKKHSAATKAKIGKAALGHTRRLGMKHTPESIAQMSATRLQPENRAKARAAKLGAKNPAWLGGISRDPYGWDWSPELKEEVRRRDAYKCRVCGVSQEECDRAFNVHHINYDRTNCDPVNLVSLCNSCHIRTNANRQHWTDLFQAMMVRDAIEESDARNSI